MHKTNMHKDIIHTSTQALTPATVSQENKVIEAVKKCWASLYSDRVDSYREMAGLARGEVKISCCVVVQVMLDPDAAGVMFTLNPFNGSLEETVVTANWGVGESVVGDLAIPDTWVVGTKDGVVCSAQMGDKKKKVLFGGQVVDTQESEQGQFCLDKAILSQLVALGTRVSAHYDHKPQDIEFGVKEGVLYLLQTRPITTLEQDTPPTINEFDMPCRPDDWITTCNAAEMFPGPMTPLTMSTFGRNADEALQRMHMEFGVRDHISKSHPVVGNYYGNFFLNMTECLAPMVSGMFGGSMTKENGEMAVLGRFNEGETLERLYEW